MGRPINFSGLQETVSDRVTAGSATSAKTHGGKATAVSGRRDPRRRCCLRSSSSVRRASPNSPCLRATASVSRRPPPRTRAVHIGQNRAGATAPMEVSSAQILRGGGVVGAGMNDSRRGGARMDDCGRGWDGAGWRGAGMDGSSRGWDEAWRPGLGRGQGGAAAVGARAGEGRERGKKKRKKAYPTDMWVPCVGCHFGYPNMGKLEKQKNFWIPKPSFSSTHNNFGYPKYR